MVELPSQIGMLCNNSIQGDWIIFVPNTGGDQKQEILFLRKSVH